MNDWLARRRFGVETGLWLAWAAATAVYLPAVLTAAFLSDGAAILWTVYDWHASNDLGRHVVTLFAGRLPTGNNYYRPLPFASFALDFIAYGAHAAGWRVTNLVGHLVAMAAVYGLARRLAGAALASECSTGVPAGAWPLLATLMFGLCAAGPEVVIWTAGRYDVMATAAVLVSLYALARSATGVDRTAVAGWLAAAVGLFCKESAAVVGPVAALVALHAAWARQPKLAGPFVRSFLRRWLPYVGLMLGYMVWREHVFGAMFRVYASDPVALHVHLAGVLQSLWGWYGGLVPAASLRALLAALAAVTLTASAWRARADGEAAGALAVTLTAAIIAVALVLPHKAAFAATGEDARLFYTASAFMAVALAVAAWPTATRRNGARVGLALVIATTTAGSIALAHNVREWTNAAHDMQALLRALETRAAALPSGDYALVLIPDHLGPVPFGRNAQGALVIPPLQRAALSNRLVPLIPDDLAAWFAKLERGIVPELRTRPLSDAARSLRAEPVSPRPADFTPSHYFCWQRSSRTLVPVEGVDASDIGHWIASWRRGLARAGCAELARAAASVAPR